MASALPAWDGRAVLEDVAALEQQLAVAAANNPLRMELAAMEPAQSALRSMVLVGPGYHVEDGTEAVSLGSTRRQLHGASLELPLVTTGSRATSPSLPSSSGRTLSPAPPASPRGPSPTSSIVSAMDHVERLAVIEDAGQEMSWYFNYFLGACTAAPAPSGGGTG